MGNRNNPDCLLPIPYSPFLRSGSVWESNPPRPALCDPPPVLKTGKPTGTQTPPPTIIADRSDDFQGKQVGVPTNCDLRKAIVRFVTNGL